MQSNLAFRSYLAFLLILLAAMLFAAIASPWVQAMLAPVSAFPLHRVFSRLMLLGLIAGVAWWICRLRDRRELLGLDPRWTKLLQHLLLGLLGGIALMAVALTPLVLLDLREWNQNFPAGPDEWLQLALKALGSGIAVALIEETLFRGAMQGALQRLGASGWALFAVPLLYSAVHFLGRGPDIAPEDVNGWSGFTVWQGIFGSFAQPLRVLDAFVALYFVGLLLALVRQRWGSIAACMGLHAGFVAVIAIFRKISAATPENALSFLVGEFDGLLGWWIAAISAVTCLAVWRLRQGLPSRTT